MSPPGRHRSDDRSVQREGRSMGRARLLASGLALLSTAPGLRAQDATPPPPAVPAAQLAPVVVTATRVEALPFDVPASIDRIGGDDIRLNRAQVNLSESLGAVPGLLARDRQNYAQDVQISVRGFGARSTFGIRGVRLYVDGIPATLPDGQGQITNVELGSVDRIEVLRGPFSALYGNSSGGVLQVFTEEGRGAPVVSFGVSGGSDGSLRLATKLAGQSGGFGYVAGVSRFTTDGYRDHSAAERRLANLKLTYSPDSDSKLTLLANSVDLPKADDPLGLSRAQFDADPRSVDPAAHTFDTRKTVKQNQGGAIYERRLDDVNALRVLIYSGHRSTVQYQSIPVATQANPLNPGGVIDLDRDYHGTDLRWTAKTALAGMPFTLVAGLAYDKLEEDRRGEQNFVGSGPTATLGVRGALRRDETNDVANFDQYLQASLRVASDWTVNAGVRHSKVSFKSTDHYIAGSNGDDSGSADYRATLPVLGLMYAVNDAVHVYASAGRGFETPTLNELAYRPNGATGLNFGLDPARSKSGEVGVKTRLGAAGDLNVALFQTRTSNEIVVLSNVGGRSTYQNAGATRRNGAEVAWQAQWQENWRAQVAYTWLDATYRDAFATCTVTPCPAPNQPIAAGNRIPGLARSSFYASLGWAPPLGWRGGIEARALSRVPVNDLNSDAAGGFTTAAANLGYVAHIGAWELTGFARADNLFDRHVAGSVIVNEGNGRFFEPAPGRTWWAGTTATLTF